MPNIEVDSDTKLTLYTGINDGMITSQVKFINELQNKLKHEVNVMVRIGNERHGDLVYKYNQVLIDSLKRTVAGTEIVEPLFPVIKGSEVTKIISYDELINTMTENVQISLDNQLDYVSIPDLIADYEIAMYFYYSDTEFDRVLYTKPENNQFAINAKIKENLLRVSLFVQDGSDRSIFYLHF